MEDSTNLPVYLFYVDESGDENSYVYVALAIRIDKWHEAYQMVRKFRRDLKEKYGVYIYKELHAWKLVTGRGRPSKRRLSKSEGVQILKQGLETLKNLPSIKVFAAFTCNKDEYVELFARLANRINRFLESENGYGILICDKGKEQILTRLIRRMKVYNPIPSQFGRWENGSYTKNIPLNRIIEDPIFKDSQHSYFIQLADFCAFALLRWKKPTPRAEKYNFSKAFEIILDVIEKRATQKDPHGIIQI